jgi:endonuclease YncB( thermonuclease family)
MFRNCLSLFNICYRRNINTEVIIPQNIPISSIPSLDNCNKEETYTQPIDLRKLTQIELNIGEPKTKRELLHEELKNLDIKQIPYFTFDGLTVDAIVKSVYDADTFSIIFKHKEDFIAYRIRCLGYDSAEMKPLKSNPNREHEKKLAIQARDRFIELLNTSKDGIIRVKLGKFEKYGRILGEVWTTAYEKSINEIMIEEGHGKRYLGGKKDTNWK